MGTEGTWYFAGGKWTLVSVFGGRDGVHFHRGAGWEFRGTHRRDRNGRVERSNAGGYTVGLRRVVVGFTAPCSLTERKRAMYLPE